MSEFERELRRSFWSRAGLLLTPANCSLPSQDRRDKGVRAREARMFKGWGRTGRMGQYQSCDAPSVFVKRFSFSCIGESDGPSTLVGVSVQPTGSNPAVSDSEILPGTRRLSEQARRAGTRFPSCHRSPPTGPGGLQPQSWFSKNQGTGGLALLRFSNPCESKRVGHTLHPNSPHVVSLHHLGPSLRDSRRILVPTVWV